MARAATASKPKAPRANTKPAPVQAKPPTAANEALTDDEIRSASYQKLVDICRQDNAQLERLQAAVKAFNKTRSTNRNTIAKAGYPLHLVDRILKEEVMSRRDLQAEADLEAWMRAQHGLPVARTEQQLELDLKATDTDRDLAYWSDDGYAAGVQGRECKPPAGIHPSFIATWTDQWGEGQKERAWALAAPTPKTEAKTPKAKPPKPTAAAPTPESEPKKEGDDEASAGDKDPGSAFDEEDNDEADAQARASVH